MASQLNIFYLHFSKWQSVENYERLGRKVKNLAGKIFFSPELTDPARDKTAVNIGLWTGDQE